MKGILLILNRGSGTGYDRGTARRLQTILSDALPAAFKMNVLEVGGHGEAQDVATRFLESSFAPALVITGGGGGTLRAVIEGICRHFSPLLPGPEQLCVATLRLGSGNLLAKQFGVPRDPETALRQICKNLLSRRTANCCVIRCEAGTRQGPPRTCYAVTMGGFGQFGRIPADLKRWHHRLPRLRKFLARFFGLENLNDIEYATALFLRSIWCVMFPSSMEAVEVKAKGRGSRMCLLSGAMMNFPFKAMPVDPEVQVGEEAAQFYFISSNSRFSPLLLVAGRERLFEQCWKLRLERDDVLAIEALTDSPVEFFLDEDPELFWRSLRIQIAGVLSFIPAG